MSIKKSKADEVMEIIAAALSGDCQKYLNYDAAGKKYCKWGVVERDIRATLDVPDTANSLLRSAYQIAMRSGQDTNWEAFKKSVYAELISEDAAKKHLDANSLDWAARWIEGSLVGETNERVLEFGKNMAMSIRAAAK